MIFQKATTILIFTILFSGLAYSQEWYLLDSDKGEFSLEFPEKPSIINDNQIHGNVEQDLIIYRYDNKELRTSYFAAVTFLGDDYIDSNNIALATANNYPNRWQGERVRMYDVELNDSTYGYEVELKLNMITKMRARIFFIKGKLYELVMALPAENIHSPKIDIFFNSFKIK
jgi:hypothetical protein